jgi:hypothetical protein
MGLAVDLSTLAYETYETYDSDAKPAYETSGGSIRPPVSEVCIS